LKIKYREDKEDLSVIYQAIGEALYDMDLFESAIEITQEAINTLDEDIDFYWVQLDCYVSLKNKRKVRKLADVIQKLSPLDPEAWYRLGVALEEIKIFGKSIEAFEYARSLGNNSKELLMNLMYVYDQNKNYGKALEKAREFLALYPDSYLINMMAVNICTSMKNWGEAVKFIDDTLKLTPDMELLYMYKSTFLIQLDEYKKAKLALMEGLKNTEDKDGELSKRLSKFNKQYPGY
jgi:tetratricopeptide (TPR) repeat protein